MINIHLRRYKFFLNKLLLIHDSITICVAKVFVTVTFLIFIIAKLFKKLFFIFNYFSLSNRIKIYKISFCFIVFASLPSFLISQNTDSANIREYLMSKSDTILKPIKDSIILKKNKESNAIESKIDYSTNDSIRFDLKEKKAYLFNNAEITYETMNLKANYIEIDFTSNALSANGIPDSTGNKVGKPIFKDADQQFRSDEMKYNFKSKKGLSKNVITQEGDGFLHGENVKKMEDDVTYISHGKYTTCDLDHPHYFISFSKAKVIPKSKIVSGPAFLVIEDVITPLFIPFGFYPTKKGQRSGILLPRYGEAQNRGFFLEDGGYYWGISDYIDMEFRGSVYSRGSWALKNITRYNKKYKYNGMLSISYAVNRLGEKETPEFSESKDFAVTWKFNQDAKARPKSRFSADVNFKSGQYNRFNPVTTTDYLSNTFSSSIAYSTTILDKIQFTLNMSESQNTRTHIVDITLPSLNISASSMYPFRRKKQLGSIKWYENVAISYSFRAENRISTYDSLLFQYSSLEKMQNGIHQTISISNPIKILKFFTLTNSVNYNERWYASGIEKQWIKDTLFQNNDTIVGYLKTDTVYGFKAAHDFSLSSSLSTRIYGILQFKRGPLRAIRHVLTPSIGFSYRPDFGKEFWGYYKEVQKDTLGRTMRYSLFQNGIFGGPSDGESGNINVALRNNLEIKIPWKKDTITGTKKLVLIENFTISGSYDLAKDSMNFSYINMSGNTRLFKYINITYSSIWDPYVIDSLGKRRNQFEIVENKRLLRLDNTSWNFGVGLSLNSTMIKKKNNKDPQPVVVNLYPDEVNFDIPWNVNINYNLVYTSKYVPKDNSKLKKVIQTLSVSGDFSLTPKWKIGVSSGYDFEAKKISYTSIKIYRDLHCWEMNFEWVPFGFRKSWSFVIRVKSSVLQDLKIEKKKDFRDGY